MYEQVSHHLLNTILDKLNPEIVGSEKRYFYSRLGANFFAIHSLFGRLYGHRQDGDQQLLRLVEIMAKRYGERSDELKKTDRQREQDHEWFLSQKWVGMALYANGFADNLEDLAQRIDYFGELGVNVVHILPILECPQSKSDGGYAVSDFRKVDPRIGTNAQLQTIIQQLHERDSLIVLDMVVNHTSDEHAWAKRAMAGDADYQNYFYTFENRDIPDMFELSMPEIFPETDPGNFTWNEAMGKWVMTVFHQYQWDLNYANPAVFIEMLDNILFWANEGVDVLRLDAVAFLWKKLSTACQNEEEAHLILQLFKDCCQVVAPNLLFIAEAIVAPSEIIRYFGEDAIVAKECEVAYNATFMALLWDSVATKNARLLYQGINSLPTKLERATWLNYLRCHDDIGFGFDDADIGRAGYEPFAHRRFLVDYFTGTSESSQARGQPFGRNNKTGDVRISGSLASLIGLEAALQQDDRQQVERCIKHIVLLHSLIMSFGGIPLLYYGDELATLNDYRFSEDEEKHKDSRWLHRPYLQRADFDSRNTAGSANQQLFTSLQRLIRVRQQTTSFADFNTRDLLYLDDHRLFGFVRYNSQNPMEKVIVIANMSADVLKIKASQLLISSSLSEYRDLWTGNAPSHYDNHLVLSDFQFYWLKLE